MGVKGGGRIDVAAAGAVNPMDYIHVESARPTSATNFDSSDHRVSKRPTKAKHTSTPSTLPSLSTGIPTDLHLALLLNKTVLSSAAILARQWLLTGHSEALHKAHQHTHIFNESANNSANTSATNLSSLIQASRIASPWAIATIIFFLAAVGQTVWLQVWTWIPSLRRSDPQMTVMPRKILVLGSIMFTSTLIWLMALERLGATTVIIFTQFCEIWMADLVRSFKIRSHGSYFVIGALVCSFVLQVIFPPSADTPVSEASFPYDDADNPLPPSLRHTRPMHLASPSKLRENSLRAELEARSYSPSGLLFGHLLLLAYAILTMERERATRDASTQTGGRRRAQVLACIAIAIPVFFLSSFGSLIGFSTLPPMNSLIPSFGDSSASSSGHSAAYLLLAVGFLILEPLVGAALEPHASTTARVTQGWPLAVGAAMIVGRLGFGFGWKWIETLVALIAAIGIRSILKTSPLYANEEQDNTSSTGDRTVSANFDGTARTHKRKSSEPSIDDAMRNIKIFASAAQDTIATIWAKEDSRKIFQFLVLNLLFMVVQLIWGVWTNSLGLISDAIHMFFDCLAIGMGLLASVMQSWKNDRVFTYGYGRIETLSGFANGIFLLLISTFIVFEGVDRIIHPPEMHNTRQLLIVSSGGLAVNLFGMFAMGGHHHHGHSHGHGHDHGHDHGGHDHHHHSHNMLGIYLHVMADTLGSVGVIISTLLIQYFGWTGFDPIASLMIAILIVGSVIPLVIDAGRILCLDLGSEREQEVEDALQELHTLKGLASFSAAHFWPKDAESVVGTIRVQLQMIATSTDSTPGSTVSTTSNGTSVTFNNISKDTSLTSLSSHSGENSPTSALPAGEISGVAPQLITPSNSLSALNGTHESPLAQNNVPTAPAISPEELMCQVEAMLKKRIYGLDFVLVQCERSNVIVNCATANRTKKVDDHHHHSHHGHGHDHHEHDHHHHH